MTAKSKTISSGPILALIVLLKVIVLGSMVYIYFAGTHMAAVQAPLVEATVKTKLEATRAHLLFEEIISGDTSESIDEVWAHIDQAEWYARAIIEGGSNEDGVYIPLDDPALKTSIASALNDLTKFRRIAELRLASRHSAAAGSPLDEQFDLVFEDLIQTMHEVRRHLRRALENRLSNFQYTQITMMIIGLLFGIVVIMISWRFIQRINANVQMLNDAAEELAHSNRDLASFAYIASHDLREPLRKIQSFGDRLISKESENMSDRGKDYIVRMQKAAARMKDLIEALLNYSRIGTKGDPFAPTDLNKVIQEVLDDLELRINETGGKVIVPDLPEIDVDKIQIRQVFQNLIANALKFQRQDVAPEIRIDATMKNDTCILKFTDNGIGFEPEYEERIFGVFQRLHGRDAFEGTGIGLSICQKTAERHGGSIVAEGRPGDGATFTLTLPIKQQETV
ncbi:MAG: ATP-binding protein [Mariprofundaceae bacterium]